MFFQENEICAEKLRERRMEYRECEDRNVERTGWSWNVRVSVGSSKWIADAGTEKPSEIDAPTVSKEELGANRVTGTPNICRKMLIHKTTMIARRPPCANLRAAQCMMNMAMRGGVESP